MSLLTRIADSDRTTVTMFIDGVEIQALSGDTVLTAILLHGERLRESEFGDGPRAGFCLMGVCQDCWVRSHNGSIFQACTTPVEEGMSLVTTI
jgi:predicted molibdopterin-dependent oxidoreductase YjgC